MGIPGNYRKNPDQEKGEFMTADQQGTHVAPTEAPAIREIEAHTSEDHRAASPETPYRERAAVAAPFQEAASLPAPSLEKEK
jgi:hypothetical protein